MSMPFAKILRVVSILWLLILSGCSVLQSKPKVIDTQAATETTLAPELTKLFADALALLRDEEFVESEKILLSLTHKYPNYAGPWTNLAIAQLSLEKYDESLININKALEIDENFCQSLSLKGVILRELGQFVNAKTAYLRAIDCDSSDIISLYNLGILSDLYMHDEVNALFYYQRYLIALNNKKSTSDEAKDAEVESWVVGLKRRIPEDKRIALVVDQVEPDIQTSSITGDNLNESSKEDSVTNESSNQPQLAGEE